MGLNPLAEELNAIIETEHSTVLEQALNHWSGTILPQGNPYPRRRG